MSSQTYKMLFPSLEKVVEIDPRELAVMTINHYCSDVVDMTEHTREAFGTHVLIQYLAVQKVVVAAQYAEAQASETLTDAQNKDWEKFVVDNFYALDKKLKEAHDKWSNFKTAAAPNALMLTYDELNHLTLVKKMINWLLDMLEANVNGVHERTPTSNLKFFRFYVELLTIIVNMLLPNELDNRSGYEFGGLMNAIRLMDLEGKTAHFQGLVEWGSTITDAAYAAVGVDIKALRPSTAEEDEEEYERLHSPQHRLGGMSIYQHQASLGNAPGLLPPGIDKKVRDW